MNAAHILSRAILVFITMIFHFSPARADYFDVGKLTKACSGSEDVDEGVCIGYIAAIADTMNNRNDIMGLTACIPQDTGMFRIMLSVTEKLKDIDAAKFLAAHQVVALTLAEKYPCNEGR